MREAVGGILSSVPHLAAHPEHWFGFACPVVRGVYFSVVFLVRGYGIAAGTAYRLRPAGRDLVIRGTGLKQRVLADTAPIAQTQRATAAGVKGPKNNTGPLAAGGTSMRNRGKQRASPLWDQL